MKLSAIKFLPFLFLISVLFAALSCTDPMEGITAEKVGSLNIKIAGTKTIVPAALAPSSLLYSYEAVRDGYDTVSASDLASDAISIPGLAYGDWTIKIIGYKDASAIYTKTAIVTISSYASTLSWELTPILTEEGTGNLAIAFNYYTNSFGGTIDVECTMAPVDTPAETFTVDVVYDDQYSLGYYVFSMNKAGLASGDYTFKFTFSQTALITQSTVIYEVVRIFDSRTTEASIDLDASDFNAPPPAVADLTGTISEEDPTKLVLTWTDTSLINEGYYVYELTYNSGWTQWNMLTKDSETQVPIPIPNGTESYMVDISDGKAHSYVVFACNDFGTISPLDVVPYTWAADKLDFTIAIQNYNEGTANASFDLANDSSVTITRGESLTVKLNYTGTQTFNTWTWDITSASAYTQPTLSSLTNTCDIITDSGTSLGIYTITVYYGYEGKQEAKTFYLTVQE